MNAKNLQSECPSSRDGPLDTSLTAGESWGSSWESALGVPTHLSSPGTARIHWDGPTTVHQLLVLEMDTLAVAYAQLSWQKKYIGSKRNESHWNFT